MWCPLGDFFGYAWGQPAMQSLLAGTTGATNYCYLPMPFDHRVVVELVSERSTPVELHAEVLFEAVKGPAQAQVQLFQNENPVADPVDLYAEKPAKSGRLLLGKLELPEGKNNLMFKLVGKNEESSGLGLDLIQVICVREP